MITFTANVRSASARSDDAITTSSVGIPVQLVLADEFMGLAKTLVFRAGATTVDVVLVGDATEAVVPPDVLTTVGLWLGIGIYAADSQGNVVIPTVWASAGLIQQGTAPSGVDPSEPTPSWVAQVQSIASEASENAETALNKATAVEEAAARGDFDGRDGTDGFSPIVTVTEISGGHEVVITDANGTQTFTVLNGTNGTDGTDGVDGFSPTVSVEEIPGGHRVTITDIDGEHTFDVMDGQGGGGGGAVDSVNGYTGEVWLTASDVGALSDTTTIPTKTSQLQNDSGFITSVPVQSVNGKTGAVVLNASDVGAYSKPSGGIPKTDLASDVQTSLGKADTALQSAPVSSVNGQTGAVVLDADDVGALPDSYTPPTEVVWFTYGTSTSADIEAAYQAGKVCLVMYNNRVYYLIERTSSTKHIFSSVRINTLYSVTCDNGTWSATSKSVVSKSDNLPAALASTASAGSSDNVSRSDHVHAMPSASDVGAVAVAQGVAHAGEFVVVGSDGNITTVTMTAWSGGSY